MYLKSKAEYFDSTNKTIQFIFVTNDLFEIYSGYWEKIGYEKIISISTQIGCKTQCKLFCNVEYFIRDITIDEILFQISTILEYLNIKDRNTIKIAMVKTGEPLDNKKIVEIIKKLSEMDINFLKLSSSMPICSNHYLSVISGSKYRDNFEIQLQVSLSSTNESIRNKYVNVKLMSLNQIQILCDAVYDKLIKYNVKYKYITLSLTIYEESEVNIDKIKYLFSIDKYCIRVRDASPDKERSIYFHRLTEKRFNLLKYNFMKAGYYFIDGRSEKIAVDNDLTIGLNRLRSIIK